MACTRIGQPVFLANLAIETNLGLQYFKGQPPNITVIENFQRDGTIREKYNVVTRSSESQVAAGYQANVIGFGWTNAAFLELLHALPKEAVEKLEKEASGAKAAQN